MDDDDWIASLTEDEFDDYFGALANVLIGKLVELVEIEVALEEEWQALLARVRADIAAWEEHKRTFEARRRRGCR